MGISATRPEVETLSKDMVSEDDDDEDELERGRTSLLAAFDKLAA